jgi:hypothetical protein
MISVTIRSGALTDKLEILARMQRQPVQTFGEALLSDAINAALEKLPIEVRNAIETLIEATPDYNTTTLNGTPVVAYAAPRLRFVRDLINPLPPHGVIRITVPGDGVYVMTKAEFDRDFANVANSRAYTQSGYYHYPSVPRKAEPYREVENDREVESA